MTAGAYALMMWKSTSGHNLADLASVMRAPDRTLVALGLLAMQDRRQETAVVRGLAALESLWHEELSATALALSFVCLDVYGRPRDEPLARLIEHTSSALTFGNHNGIAQALFALSSSGQPHAFRL